MIVYILKRLIQLIAVFFLALIVIFTIPRLLPGDPTRFIITERIQVGQEYVDLRNQLVDRFGLNRPITDQFVLYIANVFRGYLGVSWSFFPRDVGSVILERLPWTLFIMISSRVLSVFLAYFVGVIAAWKRGGKLDISLQFLGLVSIALPIFWVGTVVLLAFAYYFPVFPLGGSVTPGVTFEMTTFEGFWKFASDVLYHAALPILTLSVFGFFGESLVMRNTMVWILGEDFILTAEAKGLDDRTIMFKHAARNALLPLVTGIFMGLGGMIVGAIFVETVFSYPGMGSLMTRAIGARDFPLVQGIFILITAVTLVANFLADLVYMWLDPRVRLTR